MCVCVCVCVCVCSVCVSVSVCVRVCVCVCVLQTNNCCVCMFGVIMGMLKLICVGMYMCA